MLCTALLVIHAASPATLLQDSYAFWSAFRDPDTGLYCDSVSFSGPVCGDKNNVYSSAGTGMGLIADCAAAEMGMIDKVSAERRVLQTISSLQHWPREGQSGFFAHFTDRAYNVLGEFSTVDTAEMALGALFASNYFGGAVSRSAFSLVHMTNWTAAIRSSTEPAIFSIYNSSTGQMSGGVRPFNEYFLVAYTAQLLDGSGTAKAYFERYMAAGDVAPGEAQPYPIHRSYWGYDLLTDTDNHFVSSFIPQFCWFLTRYFGSSTYYQRLFVAWLKADMLYWHKAIPNSSMVCGKPVAGRVFGCGAGPTPGLRPGTTRYHADSIADSPNLTFSAAIMAGFLGAADSSSLTQQINDKLGWLYENDVCAYTLALPDGRVPKVLWRCSVEAPDWRSPSADSVDFATMVLGIGINALPHGFYQKYAA